MAGRSTTRESTDNSARKSARSKAKSGSSESKKPARSKKICMLGYAEETRGLVFNLDEDVEIWGINMAHVFLYTPEGSKARAKPTQWFQIHPQDWVGANTESTGNYGRPIEHVRFLDKFSKDGGIVWLQKPDERIPNAKLYPFDDLFVAAGRDYATSSFAYQLAMLWHTIHVEKQPVSDLYIYGINLTAMDEYAHQKPCVEYWLGRVEESGVKLHIPSASSLLKGPKYARGDDDLALVNHAKDRMHHHREKYFTEWSNCLVGSSMALETQHWAAFLGELAQEFPVIAENEDLRNAIQARIDKRIGYHQTTADRSRGEAIKAQGMVTDNQHWLSMVGGFDNRQNVLPELRFPSPKLAGDFELPEPRAV